jgi:hypothetical protein
MKTLLKICLLCLMIPASAHAEKMGRLFFTPEQRAQMDYDIALDTQPGDNGHALMLNGIVQMHGGKRTAWINGVPQAAGRSDERAPESVPVPLPGQNKSVKLKVGQRVLLNPSAPVTPKPDAPKQDAPQQ